MKSTKLIVFGTRSFKDEAAAFRILDGVVKMIGGRIRVVVGGKKKGADGIGYRWARAKGHKVRVFEPDWDTHKKSAGMIRNQEMAVYAKNGFAIAFWNSSSTGTLDMIGRCRHYNILLSTIIYKEA